MWLVATVMDNTGLESSLSSNKFEDDSQSPWRCGQSLLSFHFPLILNSSLKTTLFLSFLPLPITGSDTLFPHLIASSLTSNLKHISSWRGNLQLRIQVPFCLLKRRLKIARGYFKEIKVGKFDVFYTPKLYVFNNLLRGKKKQEGGKKVEERKGRKGGRKGGKGSKEEGRGKRNERGRKQRKERRKYWIKREEQKTGRKSDQCSI